MPFPSFNLPKKPKPADTAVKKKPVAVDAPIINPEADRILGRMSIQTIIAPFIGLIVLTFVMPVFNQKGTLIFKYHQIIDIASALVILSAWYGLNGRLFATRLEIGRDLVAKREFRQAAVCLQPFESFGQRFLDRTGEAHYLLAQAYAGSNNKAKAEQCKAFVLKYRPGPWAAKLGGSAGPGGRSKSEATDATGPRPKPSKSKPKRRF
jgi:hypothetical protein